MPEQEPIYLAYRTHVPCRPCPDNMRTLDAVPTCLVVPGMLWESRIRIVPMYPTYRTHVPYVPYRRTILPYPPKGWKRTQTLSHMTTYRTLLFKLAKYQPQVNGLLTSDQITPVHLAGGRSFLKKPWCGAMQPKLPCSKLTQIINFAELFSEGMPAPTYDLLWARLASTGVMLNKLTLSRSDGEVLQESWWLRTMSKAMCQPTGFVTRRSSFAALHTIAVLTSARSPRMWWTICLRPKMFFGKSNPVVSQGSWTWTAWTVNTWMTSTRTKRSFLTMRPMTTLTTYLKPNGVDLPSFKKELKMMNTPHHWQGIHLLILLMMVIIRPLDLWDFKMDFPRPLDLRDHLMDFLRPVDLWDFLRSIQLPRLNLNNQARRNTQLCQMWRGQILMNLSLQQKSFHQLLQHHVRTWTLSLPRCLIFQDKRHFNNNEHELISRRLSNLDPTGQDQALMEQLPMNVLPMMMKPPTWRSTWRTWNRRLFLLIGASSLKLATLSCVKAPRPVTFGNWKQAVFFDIAAINEAVSLNLQAVLTCPFPWTSSTASGSQSTLTEMALPGPSLMTSGTQNHMTMTFDGINFRRHGTESQCSSLTLKLARNLACMPTTWTTATTSRMPRKLPKASRININDNNVEMASNKPRTRAK